MTAEENLSSRPVIFTRTSAWRSAVWRARRDPLYRSSWILLLNTAVLTLSAFGFWTIAVHLYPPADIGNLAATVAGAALLSTIATFGLPTVLLQHLNSAPNRRELVTAAVAGISAIGSLLTVTILLGVGPVLPSRLHVAASGPQIPLIVAFVVFSSVSTATDAGLIATRHTPSVLITNLAGGVLKVVLLLPASALGYQGLMVAYVGGAAVQAGGSLVMLKRFSGRRPAKRPSVRQLISVLQHHQRFSAGTYVATLFGILPSTLVPILVVTLLGARQGAWITSAFLFAGTVTFIPANAAQALYAEIRIGQQSLRSLSLRAARGTFALVTPYVLLLVLAAPLLLQIFGSRYSVNATPALRAVAAGGLFTGATYLVDTIVIARGHVRAYVITNVTNAVLVVAGVVLGIFNLGVDGAGIGWTAGQGAALVIALGVLRFVTLRPPPVRGGVDQTSPDRPAALTR